MEKQASFKELVDLYIKSQSLKNEERFKDELSKRIRLVIRPMSASTEEIEQYFQVLEETRRAGDPNFRKVVALFLLFAFNIVS